MNAIEEDRDFIEALNEVAKAVSEAGIKSDEAARALGSLFVCSAPDFERRFGMTLKTVLTTGARCTGCQCEGEVDGDGDRQKVLHVRIL